MSKCLYCQEEVPEGMMVCPNCVNSLTPFENYRDKKMETKNLIEDGEILKILEHCSDGTGKGIIQAVIDLINRKQAEIERLKECPKCVYEYNGEMTEYCSQSPCPNFKTVDEIKSEAIKEVTSKLESTMLKQLTTATLEKKEVIYFCLNEIDNIEKEMVGD